jgi:hypothetical protein
MGELQSLSGARDRASVADKLDVPIHIGALEPMTLHFVAEDYLRHLNHHLEQIGIATSVPES